MNPLKHRQPATQPPAIAILMFSLILFSCQKEGDLSNPGTLKQTAAAPPIGAIIHPPPFRKLAWVRLTDLPFPDAIAGDVPTALIGPQGFAINGKGYLCGGGTLTSSGQVEVLNNLWEYDTATGAWTQAANFPGGWAGGESNFVVGSDAYILSGNANWQYDQPTNTWVQKVNMPGVSRSAASAFAIGSNGYAGFGYDMTNGSGTLNDFYKYETVGDKWVRMAPFPGSTRTGAMGFTVDSYGYVCSGVYSVPGSAFVYLTDLWQFDPGSDTWTSKQAFPGNGRAYGVGLGGPSHGFVGAGSDGAYNYGYYKDFYEYTPSSNTWTTLPSIGVTRNQTGSFFIGSSLYVAGGDSYDVGLKDFWTLHL
jgi:N-acetylneuraminic acid mutarotase